MGRLDRAMGRQELSESSRELEKVPEGGCPHAPTPA
jgi:hypothetical protein